MRKPLAASETPNESSLKRDKSRDLKLVGTVVAGKYKILEILGQGGFGSVFVVEMTSGILGDRLAMKILPAEFSKNTMLREQFLNEIRVAMKMVDAHIVQIRDVGITEGDPEKGGGLLYYTMDYVDGKTLGELIKEEGTLSIWRALRIARRLLPALKVAHSAGIIHRDLKPANIMVEVVGEKELPRILDFGIATAVISDTELDNSLEGGLKDKKGFVGSPYYMPPEQFQGVEMGFYTDLYSLGVILYECLTGQKPYTGRTAKEVYKKIKHGPPTPIDELQPAVGKVPGLTEMITKSLERNPEKRFQSAKEFFETLTDVMSGKNEEPQPKAGVAPAQRLSKKRTPAAPTRRAPVGRKSMSVSTIHGRLSSRRRSSHGGKVLILLGLAAFGMLGLAFKDQLLEVIQKVSEDPKTASPVTVRTPEAEPEEQAPPISPPAGSERDAPGKSPVVEPPSPEAAKPSTAERMKEIRQQLAERIHVHLKAGDAAIRRKEWDTASGEADIVLGIESDHPGALLLKARVMLNTNRSIQAIVTLETALKSVKDKKVRIEILRNLAVGHTSLQKPDWNLATTKLEEAVALDLTNKPAANLLVVAYQELNQDQKVSDFVKRAYDAGNKDRLIDKLYQQIWIDGPRQRQKSLEENTALAFRKYGEEDYYAASAAANKAFTYGAAGKTRIELADIAVDSLVKHTADFPHSPRVSTPRKLPGEARKSLRRLYEFVKETPDAMTPEMRKKLMLYDAKITYLETRNDVKKHDLETAELKLASVLNQLDSKKPTELSYEVHTWRGLVFASRGQFDGVVAQFQKARNSKNPGLMDLHASTYLAAAAHYLKEADNKKKAYDLARGRILNLLKISGLSDAKKARAYYKLGSCYLSMGILTSDDGDLRKAANRFMDARKIGMDSARLFEYLGETYHHLGEPIKAAVHYRDAYFKQPSPPRCLTAVSHFLESNPRAPQARELLVHALQKFPGDKKLLKKQLELE